MTSPLIRCTLLAMANARDDAPTWGDDNSGSDPNFLTLKLDGSRFSGGKIPLEVLADFAGLSELLIETAKWKFLQENPGRKRSPRGFTNGVELSLVDIQDGSAKPVIALVIAASAASLFPREIATFMPQAREEIADAIEAAAAGQKPSLPEHLLAHFDKFGRNLAESESIEFPHSGNQQPAKLDKKTRRALLLNASSIDELTDVTVVRGLIPEADQARKSFEVELADGRKIPGQLTTQHRAQLMEAFNGYTNRQRVLIDCVGRFNRNNRLVGIESIEQVTLLHPLDISARLDELRSLRDGWLDGAGKAPGIQELTRLENLFDAHYPDTVLPPHLYPTPHGNISAEWSLDPYEVSTEIDLQDMTAQLHSLNLNDDSERSEKLNLADDSGWRRLVDVIQALPGGEL